jgi:hypothetical protein
LAAFISSENSSNAPFTSDSSVGNNPFFLELFRMRSAAAQSALFPSRRLLND